MMIFSHSAAATVVDCGEAGIFSLLSSSIIVKDIGGSVRYCHDASCSAIRHDHGRSSSCPRDEGAGKEILANDV